MRPIPLKLREEISKDPYMKKCIYHGCSGNPEWEHAWIYSGKQINEKWAIIPCCEYHHRGKGLDKDFNRYKALERAKIEDLVIRMPKKNWRQEWFYLKMKYEGR